MKTLFNANLRFLVAQSPAGAAASPVQAPGVRVVVVQAPPAQPVQATVQVVQPVQATEVVVQAPSAQPAQATVQVVQAQEIPAGNAPFWYRLWPQHRSPLSVRMPCSHRNSLLHLAHLLRAHLQSQLWKGEHRRWRVLRWLRSAVIGGNQDVAATRNRTNSFECA